MNSRQLAILLIAANVISFVYGVYYYGGQLSETLAWQWLLVIDCPLQALLFAIVLALALTGKGSGFLTALTAAGSLKYGIWTVFIILFHGDYFLAGTFAMTYAILFIAHIGQTLEGLFLSGIKRIGIGAALLILLLYLANDYSDYWLGTHPRIPDANIGTVVAVTVTLSFLSVAFVYMAGRMKLDAFRNMKVLEGLRALVKESI